MQLLAIIHNKISKEDIKDIIRKVGLDLYSEKWIKNYSMDMRQRLGIAQAIMENPDILIFDEPMNGLDKQGVEDMWNLFKQLGFENKTKL